MRTITLSEIPIAPLSMPILIKIKTEEQYNQIASDLLNKNYVLTPTVPTNFSIQELIDRNKYYIFLGEGIHKNGFSLCRAGSWFYGENAILIKDYLFSDTMVKPSIYCNCISPVKKRVIISRTLQYYICNNCKKEVV